MQTEEHGCSKGQFYRIRRGENMREIADAFGINIEALIEANPLIHPSRCMAGQVIVIPDGDNVEYTLADGEKLSDIMRRFDVSAAIIKRLNPDKDIFELKCGDTLYLPGWSRRMAGGYIMQQGETLATLAERLEVSAIAILKKNPNLLPREFRAGQRVFLPNNAVF